MALAASICVKSKEFASEQAQFVCETAYRFGCSPGRYINCRMTIITGVCNFVGSNIVMERPS